MTEKAAKRLPNSFEDAVKELETLVEGMDTQGVGLDKLLQDYKRGAVLVKYCKERLSQVKQEVLSIDADLQLNAPSEAP
jgi:exodeoxyribonuclease VII small subunit